MTIINQNQVIKGLLGTVKRIYILLVVIGSYILCSSCNFESKKTPVKALVVLSGDLEGNMLFKEQNAVIAFKDNRDSIQLKRVILPDFERPAFVGDSVEVFLGSSKLKFGRLYKYPVKGRYLYILDSSTSERKLEFHNGVLTIGTFDSAGDVLSVDFYTYKSNSQKRISISPIGFENETAFLMEGKLGEDSISVVGFDDVYFYQPMK